MTTAVPDSIRIRVSIDTEVGRHLAPFARTARTREAMGLMAAGLASLELKALLKEQTVEMVALRQDIKTLLETVNRLHSANQPSETSTWTANDPPARQVIEVSQPEQPSLSTAGKATFENATAKFFSQLRRSR